MENFLLNLLPSIAGVLLGICYLPQVVQTIRTKSVEGMNLYFWIILNFALSFLLINSIVVFIKFKTWGYMATEFFNLGLAFLMLLLVIKYRKKETK